MFRTELDEATLAIYTAALIQEDPALLRRAVTAGIREWAFFPSVAEILKRIPREGSSQESRAATAGEQLCAAYRDARDRGLIPDYPFRSVLDADMPKLLGDGAGLNRSSLLRLAIEEPRQLTPIEHEERMQELRAQASLLLEKSGTLNEAAGLGAGLL